MKAGSFGPIAGTLVVIFFVALIASRMPAQAVSGTADEQAACTPDVFRLCASEIPNENQIVRCLNRKLASLSPACQEVLDGTARDKRRKKKDS